MQQPCDWTGGVDLADHVGPLLVVDSYRETGLTCYNQKALFRQPAHTCLDVKLPDGPIASLSAPKPR